MFPLLLALISFAGLQVVLSGVCLRRYVKRYRPRPTRARWTTVIVPVRGTDALLKTRLHSVLRQGGFPGEFIFVTTSDDESLTVIDNLIKEKGAGRARRVVARAARGCAQKLENQCAAVEQADAHAERFVFLDADAEIPEGLVTRLCAPLEDPAVGLSSGFQWPMPGGACAAGTVLKAAWVLGGLPAMTSRTQAFARGPAMAVRAADFHAAGVPARWRRALSDDTVLTEAIRDLGLSVHWVPDAYTIAREEWRFSELLEWTNRQATISRVYVPRFFWQTAWQYTGLMVIGLLAASGFATGLISATELAILALTYVVAMGATALLGIDAVARGLDERTAKELLGLRGRFFLAAPGAVVLYGINVARALLFRHVCWRGIRYVMRGPCDVDRVDMSNERAGSWPGTASEPVSDVLCEKHGLDEPNVRIGVAEGHLS